MTKTICAAFALLLFVGTQAAAVECANVNTKSKMWFIFLEAMMPLVQEGIACSPDKMNPTQRKNLTQLNEWHCLCSGVSEYERSKYRRDQP